MATSEPVRAALGTWGGDVRALLYLDVRLLVNRLRLILHDPRRLVPWLLVLGWIGFWRLFRLLAIAEGRPAMPASHSLLTGLAPLVPGIYLVLLGLSLFRAAARAPATFRSPADARFLIGSRLPPRLVVGWLQLRRVLNLMVVSVFNVLLVIAFVPLAGDSSLHLGLLFLAILGGYVVLQAAPMAVYFIGRRHPRLPFAHTGVVLTGLGGASLAIAILQLLDVAVPVGPPVTLLTQLPPGEWIRDAYHGQHAAAVLMLLLSAVSVALTVRLSGDAYPELWESSSRMFTLRQLARQRGGLVGGSDVRRALGQRGHRSAVSVSGAGVPSGAGAILWKEWLALRRARTGLVLLVCLSAGALVMGTAVGLLAAAGEDGLASSLVLIGLAVMLMVNVYGGLRLGADLRNPVWWLSAASLRQRLLAWTVASTLRQAVPACLGCAAAVSVAGDPALLVVSVLAVPVGVWALRMVTLATYAMVPSQTDLRGPGRLLRMLLLVATVWPPAVVLVLFVFFADSPAAGAAAAGAVLLGEGWLLLELATWLLRRNGVGHARAEAR